VLLDTSVKLDSTAAAGLLKFVTETRNKQATDDLILGHMYLVKWLAGRYLYHWPETRRFEDDMVAEGLLAITAVTNRIVIGMTLPNYRGLLVTTIKQYIEDYINDNRSLVRATRIINQRRVESGQPAEYATVISYHDNEVAATCWDDALATIDIWDTVEFVQETDKEIFIDHVMAIMENYKGLEERELPLSLRGLIEQIVDIVKGTEIASED
jgi:hypothetical protein